MSIVDLILTLNSNEQIEDVIYLGDAEEWFYSIPEESYKQRNLKDLFGDVQNQPIVEFHNRFFRCQKVRYQGRKQLFLSSDSLLRQIYEETLNKVSEGIQVFDRNGYFVYGNPASEKLEEYSQSEFKGKHLLDLYNLSEDFSTTLSVIRTGKPVLNRCDRFKSKSNKELVTINSGYPLIMNDAVYGVATFESDLSVINNIRNRSFNLEAFIRDDQPVIEKEHYHFNDIVHRSESIAQLIKFAKKIALTNANILIVGETGTGKELFAQSIHAYSPRNTKPFIDVNCSAVPSNLIESLFFGTEKGAFTGSMTKKGFLEMADGGTLFLDEINSMSLDMQAKLLRVLQEKRFRRVGGSQYRKCDIRVIAASNEDLLELVKRNIIRKDFYYRISALSIQIPPLKERKEDIPELAQHFLDQLCQEYGRSKMRISERVLGRFISYEWPGNVRELHHVLEYCLNHASNVALNVGDENLPKYLKTDENVHHYKEIEVSSLVHIHEESHSDPLNEQLRAFEKEVLLKTLKSNAWNITKAAKSLGLSRQSLQYRIKRLGIAHEDAE